jgi:hypothetical protein
VTGVRSEDDLLDRADGILYVCVLQTAWYYELEQVSKIDIGRKLKQRFGANVIRDVCSALGELADANRKFDRNASCLHKP